MSRCLPCEKDLLNGLTETRLSNIHSMAQSIPSLVSCGRLKPEDADEIYEMMISNENAFGEGYDSIANKFASSVAPEWGE